VELHYRTKAATVIEAVIVQQALSSVATTSSNVLRTCTRTPGVKLVRGCMAAKALDKLQSTALLLRPELINV